MWIIAGWAMNVKRDYIYAVEKALKDAKRRSKCEAIWFILAENQFMELLWNWLWIAL